MPLMDGYEFVKRVKEIRHDVKVFFMSAYLSDDIQFRTGLSLVKVEEYIEKPTSVNDFIRMVKKILSDIWRQKHTPSVEMKWL